MRARRCADWGSRSEVDRRLILGLRWRRSRLRSGRRRSAAQDPPALSIRPFVMATEQSFAAVDTFDAMFGKTYGPFFGGGVQVVFNDASSSRSARRGSSQTGERAFISGGKAFKLGIPLTATITPLEVTGGYRFRLRQLPRVRPYVAAGFGSYGYQETSQFAEAGEDVDTRHAGFRAERRRGVPAAPAGSASRVDVQYTPRSGHPRHRRRLPAGGGDRPRRRGRAVQAGRGPLTLDAAPLGALRGRIIDADDSKRQRSSLAAPGAARDGDLCRSSWSPRPSSTTICRAS